MAEDKKKFIDRLKEKHPKAAEFLQTKAPSVLKEIVKAGSTFIPGLGILNALIQNDSTVASQDKEEWSKMGPELKIKFEEIAADLQKSEDMNVTERWKADMSSDSWLSKNTRPLVMLSLLAFLFGIIITDSIKSSFEVKPEYVSLLSTLLVTTVVAYFGSRGVEKSMSMVKKK